MSEFVPFDSVVPRLADRLMAEPVPDGLDELYLERDMYGKVRLSTAAPVEQDKAADDWLKCLATDLHRILGARSYPPEQGVLFVLPTALATLRTTRRKIQDRMYWADRLVTGERWSTVDTDTPANVPRRFTLYSVKGGVGRSTTAAVLARDLARYGERVLVVDLDLESPGPSAMLNHRTQPEFGITDWFVEDLIGQGDRVLHEMTASPTWAGDLEGEVYVAPALGRDPGEYLAKLGRVHLDIPDPWTERLQRLLHGLEVCSGATVVLLESRSGLHDIAAAAVTDLNAQVLLFAVDAASVWSGYDILFRLWQEHDLAATIRECLWTVPALTPEVDSAPYLDGFREHSWNLFRDRLYDAAGAGDDSAADQFTFDINDEEAPHAPLPIYWNRGLAAGSSLRNFEQTPVSRAYSGFLERFHQILKQGESYNHG